MASTQSESTAPIVTIKDGRATIRLNRPREHNRIEPDDLAVLRETFTRIDEDPRVRVLVLTGTGKSFSSGYHIGALVERHATKRDGAEPGSDSFERVVDSDCVLIGLAIGFCFPCSESGASSPPRKRGSSDNRLYPCRP